MPPPTKKTQSSPNKSRRRLKGKGLNKKQHVQVKRAIKKVVDKNLEKKYLLKAVPLNHRVPVVPLLGPSALEPVALSDCLQGVSVNQRIGNTIKPTSLEVAFELQYDATNTPVAGRTGGTVRVIIFRWNELPTPNITALIDVAQTQTLVAPIRAEFYRGSKGFIVYDEILNVRQDMSMIQKYIRFDKQINGITEYSSADLDSYINGSYWIFIVTQEGIFTPDKEPYLNLNTRLWYTDA